jgi:HSP20 family protein
MAKKEKEGNGANVTEQNPEQKSSPPAQQTQLAERPRTQPARRSNFPLRRLRDEMDLLFDRFFGRSPTMWWEPEQELERFWDMDLEESDNEIMVRLEAPGFDPKDFDIRVSGNTLTVRGEHTEGQQEQGEKKEQQGQAPRRWEQRRFVRSITLSSEVNADKVEARYRNGVLELHLPRTEDTSRRRIEVKTSQENGAQR